MLSVSSHSTAGGLAVDFFDGHSHLGGVLCGCDDCHVDTRALPSAVVRLVRDDAMARGAGFPHVNS